LYWLYFLTPQKNPPCISLIFIFKKNMQVFLKKNFCQYFLHVFFVSFFFTKHWFCRGFELFIKKFFPAFGGTSLFFYYHTFWPPKNPPCISLTFISKKTFKYFSKMSIFFTCFFCVIFLTKHWPRLLPGLWPFYKKIFSRLRRDIPIFYYHTFWPPKKSTMYFTDRSLVTPKKTFKYFSKKNCQKISHVFFVIFLTKHWPRLLPGLCPFYKKIFSRLRRDTPTPSIILFDLQKIHYVTDRSLLIWKKNFQVFF